MKKILLKYRHGFLLIFPLLLVIFSYREADTRFSHDLSRFFEKADHSKEEAVLFTYLTEAEKTNFSVRRRKELSRAVVRFSQKLQFPDGTLLGGNPPNPSLFLLAWAKTRSEFRTNHFEGYGIFTLPEIFVREFEMASGTRINRDYDIQNDSIQLKMVILKLKEYISEGKSVKDAYQKLYGKSITPNEWETLESNYKKIYEFVTSESKP
ncbi:hypothetical protein ND861_01290 [Leptospira sp. 2 VSF19]|uniref:Uncharacterized protein n=1 Tax=Leptospira soteropolitanensis TaxID=2950025 RepID=A0AAW5VHZ6_9LEPT|nr:hypothetical protein [Leptospira soteropolitanensis]MCW7491279.1 hypothetical protein [Leptospira soteropolitanensis]MCW7498864.1 hypothetical protein [Leptospira soteropolitanensis]MCW7521544.1 hypothetical protein [Leptospira soteropolitanensis]MCW7524967.1 hypothetical protein [Leptospira soteropolitanensis]MCW7528835.1 hypothetical protein [Leptospira soteropolitanensis]